MAEAILTALWIGTALFFLCREIKLNDDRKSREYYLSELRCCIDSIEHEFQERCRETITNAFSGRNVSGGIVVHKYWEGIIELKKQYMICLYEKVNERMKWKGIRFSTIPDYLVKEYETNISEIAYTFHNIGDFMLEQIKDITNGDFHSAMKL